MSAVRAYTLAGIAVAIATLAGLGLGARVTLADDAMLYVAAILFAAPGGRRASFTASALSVAAYDFFFVPPRFTFAVSDARSLITFAMMFVVGIASGTLIARLRAAEAASREREHRTAALLSFTRDAAAATDLAGVEAAMRHHIAAVHGDARLVEAVAHQAHVAIERLQLADAAREAALRAKAEELRSALLSSVSHDLRTPLAAITGMATALRERATGDTGELDTIVEEAQRLSRLLTNLLAITKVESGAEPRREWVPLEELVGSALGRLETELALHPVRVEVPATALARVDPILVEQLLINVLDNAAKHTSARTPIDVVVTREAEAAVVEVADRGAGLAAEQRARIFDKFYRASATGPGAGLGLAVCRGIAVAHHGTIVALAREGGGTRIVVRIPDEAPLPDLEELAS